MSKKTDPDKPAPSTTGALKSPKWLLWLFAGLIVAGSLLSYGGGLDNGFTNWDDNWLITENRHIREMSWQNFQYWFNPSAPREELGNEYLPLRDLSYAVNYAFDGYEATGYHATNLLLHILISLLVMLFAYRLTGRRWIGGVAGLLFAVHPVHVEAVSWLSSRKDLLSTFFLLLSANFYLSARRSRTGLMSSESFVQRVHESTRLSWFLAVLFFVCALLSKMTSVVLPALLLLIELFRGHKLHALSKPKRALAQAPFWVVALLFTALASHIGSGLMREPYGANKFESLLTAISAITRDFQVLIAGYPLHAAVDLPVQTGFTLPVIIGLLILIVLVGVGLIGWRESREGWETRRAMAWGVAGFGALWFLVALSPVSNILVQIGTVFAERYLYIPSIGFCIAIAALGVLGVEQLRKKESLRVIAAPAGAFVLALVVGAWGFAASQATDMWAGSVSLWNRTLAYDPGNHIAYFNLGRVYQEQAMVEPDEQRQRELLDQAEEHYRQALENQARTYRYDPARVYAALALVSIYRHEPEEALTLLEEARKHVDLPWRDERAKQDVEALLANPRGLAYSAMGEHDQAVAAFEETIAKSERYPGARVNLASELTRVALTEQGIDEEKLNRAKSLLNEYERSYGRTEQLVEARARTTLKEFETRLGLSGVGGQREIPKDLQPLLDDARKHYSELIALRDQGVTPNAAMAATLIEAADAYGRGTAGDATAEKYLRRALKLKPDYKGLRSLLAQLLFEKASVLAEKGQEAAPTRAEATNLVNEELSRHPDYTLAKQLRAAGLRQRAVNEADALIRNWKPEYQAITGDTERPSWYRFILELQSKEAFRQRLLLVTTLMREAIELDPGNDEGHGLIEGSGREIAIGMWLTRDPELRAYSEELLRTVFNARPVDGDISAALTQFYLDLASELLRKPKEGSTPEERRAEMDTLLTNMLTLSERARRILSNKLFKTGLGVEGVHAKQIDLTDESGNVMNLSQPARRLSASEFIRAATLLNPENIEALDWLKKYYEEEGDYDEALKTFGRLIEALKDRPELMHGVYLSLAQLQLDYGQQLLTAYKGKLRLNLEAEAAELRRKAVQAYREALETTGQLIDKPEDASKLNLPIRLRGVAAQRLAYLEASRAFEYYTMALDAYELAPLDFQPEIVEVRRKRAWFERDPYERLKQLQKALEQAGPDEDVADIRRDIIDLERRIIRIEAEDFLKRGELARALDKVEEGFNAPTPQLYAIRGEIYLAMAAKVQELEERDAYTMKAGKDLVRAYNEPEALVKGGDLYWEHEAFRYEEDQVVRARDAYERAADVITTAQVTMDEGTPEWKRYETLLSHVRGKLADMTQLAMQYLAAAQAEQKNGRLEDALGYAERAHQLLGAHVRALHVKALILRDLAKLQQSRSYAEEARLALNAALRVEHLLTSQRLGLMYDLILLLLEDLDDKDGARQWTGRLRDTLAGEQPKGRTEQERDEYARMLGLYRSRLAELEQRLR